MITLALLAVATGLCLFDGDAAGGHLAPPDLCLGMLAASLAVMPLAGLVAVGWAIPLPFAAVHAVALYVPDPPPRPAPLR